MLDPLVIRRWTDIRDAAAADEEWLERQRQLIERRLLVQRELQQFIQEFLSGRIDTETLRSTFDSKTRVVWTGFGLKGMSYAMFLNKLLKYLGSDPSLAVRLRETLSLPADPNAGRTALRGFHRWLDELISEGIITRKSVQPARAPAFVSAFWHMQAREQWPVYYESARSVLEREGLLAPATDVDDAYFRFRDVFLDLAQQLSVDTWTLEQLCHRVASGSGLATAPGVPPAAALNDVRPVEDASDPSADEPETIGHTHVQWLLATIGRQLGCQIWIAANDRSKIHDGTRLGSLSLEALPRLGLGEDVTRRLMYIDVLWLKGNQVFAAFEVEHTTSIYSGLLRLSDLVAAAPNLNFDLYIVSPEQRLRFVEAELRRPTFQTLDLHKHCGFFSETALLAARDGLMQWASDPRAIHKLAKFVDDVDSD